MFVNLSKQCIVFVQLVCSIFILFMWNSLVKDKIIAVNGKDWELSGESINLPTCQPTSFCVFGRLVQCRSWSLPSCPQAGCPEDH